MNCKLKSRLDLIRPDINTIVTNKQQNQKDQHDLHVSHRTFVIGQQVYTLIYRNNIATWVPGTIEDITGPVSYRVRLKDDYVVRRHVDQLRGRSKIDMAPEAVIYDNIPLPETQTLNTDVNDTLDQTAPPNLSDTPHSDVETPPGTHPEVDPIHTTQQPTRKSTRERKPVERLISTI